jgi:hypothetical protein
MVAETKQDRMVALPEPRLLLVIRLLLLLHHLSRSPRCDALLLLDLLRLAHAVESRLTLLLLGIRELLP